MHCTAGTVLAEEKAFGALDGSKIALRCAILKTSCVGSATSVLTHTVTAMLDGAVRCDQMHQTPLGRSCR